MTARTTLDN